MSPKSGFTKFEMELLGLEGWSNRNEMEYVDLL